MSWEYLQKLTTEAKCLKVVIRFWVYDNVSLHQKVRHEREGKQCTHTFTSHLGIIHVASASKYVMLITW